MAAHDMIDTLKHPHYDDPFVTFGDDTITALASNNFQKQVPKACSAGNFKSTN
jgi:hypothetical protein